MAILIVGADGLGNINKEICSDPNEHIIHWKGRTRTNGKKYVIPTDVDKIIIFYDFINHNLMHLVKKQAKKNNLPIIYSRRAMTNLREVVKYKNFFDYKT